MNSIIVRLATVLALAAGAGALSGAAAQEQLFDRNGRPIPQSQLYPEPGYTAPRPYYQPPGYSPYEAPQRRSRYQQGSVCSTDYGTCDLPGPMFVGKGCRCQIPGAGRVSGVAVP